jgi:hypothetical protein
LIQNIDEVMGEPAPAPAGVAQSPGDVYDEIPVDDE